MVTTILSMVRTRHTGTSVTPEDKSLRPRVRECEIEKSLPDASRILTAVGMLGNVFDGGAEPNVRGGTGYHLLLRACTTSGRTSGKA